MDINVGLIDADLLDNGTRHPNLALMKISTFCKTFGKTKLLYTDEDVNNINNYDVIIISKVFNYTKLNPVIIDSLKKTNLSYTRLNECIFKLMNNFEKKFHGKTLFAIGGTGFFPNGGVNLHPVIEHTFPDYELYSEYIQFKIKEGRSETYFNDYLNFSIGFTTRGCFRKCDFCVNKKYSRCTLHSPVSEFIDPERSKVYLWDDNVFACKDWELVFDQLDRTNKPFQFRQGLDIRLLTEKKAKRLAQSKYYGDVIFAFDHVDDYNIIDRRLKIWRKYSKKTTKLYLICAFDPWEYNGIKCRPLKKSEQFLKEMSELKTQESRDQKDIEGLFIRIELLMKYRCHPYIMRYEKYKDSKYRGMYIQLARWCNQPQFYKKMSFREFCNANQRYSKGTKLCSSMKAMIEFEKDRPDIAKKYFDIKYENY